MIVSENEGLGWTGTNQQHQLPHGNSAASSLRAPVPSGEAPRPGPTTAARLARSPGREGADGTTHLSGMPIPTSKKTVCKRKRFGSGRFVLHLLTGDSVMHRGNVRTPSAPSRV